jgi:hypothetical protein
MAENLTSTPLSDDPSEFSEVAGFRFFSSRVSELSLTLGVLDAFLLVSSITLLKSKLKFGTKKEKSQQSSMAPFRSFFLIRSTFASLESTLLIGHLKKPSHHFISGLGRHLWEISRHHFIEFFHVKRVVVVLGRRGNHLEKVDDVRKDDVVNLPEGRNKETVRKSQIIQEALVTYSSLIDLM